MDGTISLAFIAAKKLSNLAQLSTATDALIPISPVLWGENSTISFLKKFTNIYIRIIHAIADNRYRVELLVDDGNNYAIVVVLNKEMLKLTKQDAANLPLNEVISKPQTLIKTVAITQISKKLQVNRGITLYTHLDVLFPF